MKRSNWFWAIPLIVVGVVWQLFNLDIISSRVFHIVVSWQVLLMYIGVVQLLRKQVTHGLFTFGFGLLFLLPKIGILDYAWLRLNWPLILIVAGIVVLLKPSVRKRHLASDGRSWVSSENGEMSSSQSGYVCEEGYVEIRNFFGSVKQIVFDPVFKGANISNVFGGIVLDLRRATLDSPETVIDIDCVFAGTEIYLPSSWFVHNKTIVVMGGCEDKRFLNTKDEMDDVHVLVIRGNVVFGSIELKS